MKIGYYRYHENIYSMNILQMISKILIRSSQNPRDTLSKQIAM